MLNFFGNNRFAIPGEGADHVGRDERAGAAAVPLQEHAGAGPVHRRQQQRVRAAVQVGGRRHAGRGRPPHLPERAELQPLHPEGAVGVVELPAVDAQEQHVRAVPERRRRGPVGGLPRGRHPRERLLPVPAPPPRPQRREDLAAHVAADAENRAVAGLDTHQQGFHGVRRNVAHYGVIVGFHGVCRNVAHYGVIVTRHPFIPCNKSRWFDCSYLVIRM